MIQKPRLSTAFDAFKEKDYDETVKQFKDQANRGDPVAQYNLGIIYETGVGGYRDDEMAEGYYRKAARSGDAEAQLQLATIIGGDVLLQEQPKPIQWKPTCSFLLKSSDREEKKRLLIESYMWCWLAAAQKHRRARKGLRRLKKHMLPEEIGEAESLAKKWRPDFFPKNNFSGHILLYPRFL